MTTTLCAAVVKLLTGARLIVEIVTTPHLVYITERARPGLRERVMKVYSDLCLHFSVFVSDRLHLLSGNQLEKYPLLRRAPASIFHEFVPVSIIGRSPEQALEEPYILLMGAPWYLKGADLLVRAFLSLTDEFPQFKLRIMGHYPQRTELERMTQGSDRIEILKARPHVEALKIIAGASILAAPSRCEGMGRVIVEGMAAGVPVIGSDIGGIPSILQNGENGLLFTGGDWLSLASNLRRLLEDPALRSRLGKAGYSTAHNELNERVYVSEFVKMIKAVQPQEKGTV
jgi:glycosyltransferase involved in cell wall biosynthesis